MFAQIIVQKMPHMCQKEGKIWTQEKTNSNDIGSCFTLINNLWNYFKMLIFNNGLKITFKFSIFSQA